MDVGVVKCERGFLGALWDSWDLVLVVWGIGFGLGCLHGWRGWTGCLVLVVGGIALVRVLRVCGVVGGWGGLWR